MTTLAPDILRRGEAVTRTLATRSARLEHSRMLDELRRNIVLGAGPAHPEFGRSFMRFYLPHYCQEEHEDDAGASEHTWVESALFHDDLFGAVFSSMGTGRWNDYLAPRGYAKTTIIGMGLPIAALGLSGLILQGKVPRWFAPRHYVWLIQSEGGQAAQSMENIIEECRGNPRILRDFPHLRPKIGRNGRAIADRSDDIVFELELRLQALGSGMKLRGRRHRQYRPDLVLIDDLENDEHVQTKFQRDKLEKWLDSAVAFAIAKGGDVHMLGTLLHSDAVLARVRKKSGWHHHRYDAFTDELVDCPDHGWHVTDDDDKAAPLHEECDLCMGAGVVKRPSWEYRDLYWHALQRARTSHTAYAREILHVVTDPGRKRFPEEWFKYEPRPEGPDVRCVISVDPNAKEKEDGDPAAIAVLMKRRGERRFHVDFMWLRPGLRGKALRERVVDAYTTYKQAGYSPVIVFETQQAQEWGKQELEDAGLPVKGVDHTTDKLVRAEQASLHYEMGRVTHAPELRGNDGEAQLDAFPDGDHDDIVDAITTGLKHLEEAESGGGVAGAVRRVPGPTARRMARDKFRDPREA